MAFLSACTATKQCSPEHFSPVVRLTLQTPVFRQYMATVDMAVVETAMNDVEDLPKSMVGAGCAWRWGGAAFKASTFQQHAGVGGWVHLPARQGAVMQGLAGGW